MRVQQVEWNNRPANTRTFIHTIALISGGLGVLACGSEPPNDVADAGSDIGPELPQPSDNLLLGAAGAPVPTFGSDTAPNFETPFANLAAAGFNRFIPIFLTDESGEGTNHPLYFLPPSALPGVPTAMTCAGSKNPWARTPAGFAISLPAYLLIAEQPLDAPIEEAVTTSRLQDFVDVCLDGDPTRAGEIYLYDEPANNYVASTLDQQPGEFELANVGRLATAARAVVGVPTVLVEAPIPFILPYTGVSAEELAIIEPPFWQAVDETATETDYFGFDIYPAGLTDDFTVLANYLRFAMKRSPNAKPLIVLQGSGYADMGIDLGFDGRRPTREETRNMAYVAFAGGAQAIYWYGQSALTSDDSDTWEHILEVVGELRALSGLLTLTKEPSRVTGNDQIISQTWRDGDTLWLVAANPSGEHQAFDVGLPAGATVYDALTRSPVPTPRARPWRVELAAHGTMAVAMTR